MEWSDKKILVIGGDQRLLYLADLLKNTFSLVQSYALDGVDLLEGIEKADSLESAMEKADIVIAPVPFTKDGIHLLTKDNTIVSLKDFGENLRGNSILFGGNIPNIVMESAKMKHVKCFDFMQMEDVALENAITTAEGAIAEAIALSTQNINQEHCLVLGYGRCAQAIAERLKGLNAKVTIGARKEEARKNAISLGYQGVSLGELHSIIPSEQFIFNTIPAMVLDAELIGKMYPDSIIIDIATSPGGTDFDACKRRDIKAKLSLGIPGRYSPKTSANILLRGIKSSLELKV